MDFIIRFLISAIATTFILFNSAHAIGPGDIQDAPACPAGQDCASPKFQMPKTTEGMMAGLQAEAAERAAKEALSGTQKAQTQITSLRHEIDSTEGSGAAQVKKINQIATTESTAIRKKQGEVKKQTQELKAAIAKVQSQYERSIDDPVEGEKYFSDLQNLKAREEELESEQEKLEENAQFLEQQRDNSKDMLTDLGADPKKPQADSPPSPGEPQQDPAQARAPSPGGDPAGKSKPGSEKPGSAGGTQPKAEPKAADNKSGSGGGSPSMPSLPTPPTPQTTPLAMPTQLSPPAGSCPPDQPNCMLCVTNPRGPGCPGAQDAAKIPEAVKQDQATKQGGQDSLAGPGKGGKTPLDLSALMNKDGQRSGGNGQLPQSGAANVGSRGGSGSSADPGYRGQQGGYGSPTTLAGSSGSYSGSGGGAPGSSTGGYPNAAGNAFAKIAEKTIGKANYQKSLNKSLNTARYARSMHEQMFDRYRRGPAAQAAVGTMSARLKADGVTGPTTNQFNKMRSRYTSLFDR